MKKTAFRLIFVLGLIGFGSIVILSASGSEEENVLGENSQYINESFPASIDEIKFEIATYSIFIETHEGDEIIVEASVENSKDKDPLRVDVFGNTLEIIHIAKTALNFNYDDNRFGTGTIVVKVPADSMYNYEYSIVSTDIKMHASAKDVLINDISSKIELFAPIENLNADTVSGVVKVRADGSSHKFTFNGISGDTFISLADNIGYTVSCLGGSIIDEYNNTTISNKTSSYGDVIFDISISGISCSVILADWQ